MSAGKFWKQGSQVLFDENIKYSGGITDGVIHDCNNGAGMKIIKETSENEYIRFIDSIEKSGYTRVYSENTYGMFNEFLKDRVKIYAYYLPNERCTRIIYELSVCTPQQSERDAQRKATKTKLHQLKLDYSEVDCGMSYIFETQSGSIFIIDGGSYGEQDSLYEYLTKIKPDGELVIEGWFFSHIHNDHYGCFVDFAEKYPHIRINAFYYNFPSLGREDSGNWDDVQGLIRFYETMEAIYPNVPNYKVHTGQTVCIDNLRIKVLMTHEDLYPMKALHVNDTSTIIMVEAEGQKIFFPGDTADGGSDFLIRNFREYLKADIVQISHHGFNGAKIEVYQLNAPEVVLWPTPQYCLLGDLKNRAPNRFLAYETGADQFVNDFGTVCLILPYKKGSISDNKDKFCEFKVLL